MAEELNSNDKEIIDVEQLISDNAVGESSEVKENTGAENESENISSENSGEKVEQKQEFTPDAEVIELIKSVRGEVGEKRFNGLMSAWQKDRSELKKYQEKPQTSTASSQDGNDDALVDYLDKKLEAKRLEREKAVQDAIQKEVDEVRSVYPDFTEQKLFETANKLSIPGKPVSLMTAAMHLAEVETAINANKNLALSEAQKKKSAGTIAGRSGIQNQTGIHKYNPEKDKNKSISELVDEAFAE